MFVRARGLPAFGQQQDAGLMDRQAIQAGHGDRAVTETVAIGRGPQQKQGIPMKMQIGQGHLPVIAIPDADTVRVQGLKGAGCAVAALGGIDQPQQVGAAEDADIAAFQQAGPAGAGGRFGHKADEGQVALGDLAGDGPVGGGSGLAACGLGAGV